MLSCSPEWKSPGSIRFARITAAGFTLLEVLLVIFIISLILTVAVPRLFHDDPDTVLMDEARRLARKLELANQEATFRNLQIGVLINPDEYRFLYFEKDKWLPLDHDILKPYRLKNGIAMNLIVEGFPQSLESKEKGDKPQIAILSNGEFTPFELKFRFTQQYDLQADLQVNPLGEIKLDLVQSR